jgi:putative FmdB family regulatory protein
LHPPGSAANIKVLNRRFAVPRYEYQCQKCRKRFSLVEPISAHTRRSPACPKCKSRATRQVLSAFYAKTVKKS